MILTIYLMRLILHGLPQGNSPFLSFFPLDLQGQSGYEILLIGQNINKLLPFPPQSWVLFEILPPQARRLLKWYVYVYLSSYGGSCLQSRVGCSRSPFGDWSFLMWLSFLKVNRLSIFKILVPLRCLRKSYRVAPTIQLGNTLIPRRSELSDPYMRYAHC